MDNANHTGYKVTIDPGNGQVFQTSEGIPLCQLTMFMAEEQQEIGKIIECEGYGSTKIGGRMMNQTAK